MKCLKHFKWNYQDSKRCVGVGIDIRMSGLVDLEQDQDGDGVHEGSVELEVRVVRTHVVAPTHYT